MAGEDSYLWRGESGTPAENPGVDYSGGSSTGTSSSDPYGFLGETTGTDTSSGSGLPDFGDFGSFLGGLYDKTIGGMTPQQLGFLGSAGSDWWNSNQYMDLAGKYADKMDPFGGQRGYYQGRLKQLTEDPNAYLASSPDYQAALKQGLGALDSSMSAKGFSGSGHAAMDAMNYGSQLGAQYLDRDRQSLMQMAGAQIGPGAAANMITHGIDASVAARNNALTNLTRALFPNQGTQGTLGSSSGLGAGLGSLLQGLVKSGYTDAASLAKSLAAQGLNPDMIKSLLGSYEDIGYGSNPYVNDLMNSANSGQAGFPDFSLLSGGDTSYDYGSSYDPYMDGGYIDPYASFYGGT